MYLRFFFTILEFSRESLTLERYGDQNCYMKTGKKNQSKGSVSRREFTRRSILLIAAAGTAGLTGYGLLNGKKIRSINNIRRMGHCAPSVMQTLLGINHIVDTGMVKNAGALAGGIAGSDMECGVLTAPLMFIGYQNNNLTGIGEKLNIITQAQSYVQEFTAINGSTICSKIRQDGQPACMHTIRNFYKPYSQAITSPVPLSDEAKESYTLLLETFDEKEFHCAHNVLKNLNNDFPVTKELFDSSWLFIGGIALLNRTCGALAAGAMALSSVTARIEYSYARVARMNRLLRQKDNEAMDEEINNFNRSINISDELGSWFRNKFGSTSCHELCGLNFSYTNDVKSYISGPCIDHCANIAEEVAEKVSRMI